MSRSRMADIGLLLAIERWCETKEMDRNQKLISIMGIDKKKERNSLLRMTRFSAISRTSRDSKHNIN